MSIMTDVGRLLGSSSRLKEIVSTLTERTIQATYTRRQQQRDIMVAKQRSTSSGSMPSISAPQNPYDNLSGSYNPNVSPFTTTESPSHSIQAMHVPQFNPQISTSTPSYPTHSNAHYQQPTYANEWLNYGRAIAYYPEVNPQTIGIGQALLAMGSAGPSGPHPQQIHSPQQPIVSPMAPQPQPIQQHSPPPHPNQASVMASSAYPPQPGPRVVDAQNQGQHTPWQSMGVSVNAFGYPETNPRPNGA